MSGSSQSLYKLEWGICLDAFDAKHHQPMVLQCCGQAICAACVKTIRINNRFAKCPLCNQTTNLRQVVVNRILGDIISRSRKPRSQSRSAARPEISEKPNPNTNHCNKCSFDNSLTDAVCYCFECNYWLCTNHESSHMQSCHSAEIRWAQEIHSKPELKMCIVPRFDISSCMTHGNNNLLVMWCTQCKVLVCAECIKADHLDHVHQTLEEAWNEMSKALTSMLQSANDGISKCTAIKLDMSKRIGTIESSEKRLIESVRKLEQDLVAKSHQHASRLVADIRARAQRWKEPLKNELSVSSAELMSCSQLASDIRHCLQVTDFKALAELTYRESPPINQSVNPVANESYLAQMSRTLHICDFTNLQLCSIWSNRVENDVTGALDFWFSLTDDTSDFTSFYSSLVSTLCKGSSFYRFC